MDDSDFIVSEEHLPEGIAERIDDPPSRPALPRPAATVVLMRDADVGVEILLLKRVHSAGFVPGAYVFPGGRVDRADADPAVLDRSVSLTEDMAAERMRLPDADPPAVAYYLAALREAFEETGILVGHLRGGDPLPTAAASPSVLQIRDRLLDDVCSFAQALDDLGALIDDTAMEYIGHWITPIAEPRRYDARFFAAAVAPESKAANPPRTRCSTRFGSLRKGRWSAPRRVRCPWSSPPSRRSSPCGTSPPRPMSSTRSVDVRYPASCPV